MPNGQVSLGYLRLQSQQRADLENNPSVSDSEWNGYISSSYKELYDKLVAAYGNDYYVANPYQFSLTGAQFYPLPDGSNTYLDQDGNPLPAFYKLLGVDLQYSGSPTGWVSLKRFEFIERNKYAYPNTTVNINGYTNLKYRITANNLFLIPTPATSQAARAWYVPEPTSLQFAPTCQVTAGNTTITASDVTALVAGMNCFGPVGIPDATTVVSVNQITNEVVLSASPTSSLANATLLFWIDSTLIDGIAGWEEYVIIDAAIKANIKTESPIDGLAAQLQKMSMRIDSMSEGRDIGQAQHVSDALSLNGYGSDDDGGGGFGGGGSGWGGY